MQSNSWTVSYFEENKDHCLQTLIDPTVSDQIPSLNDAPDYTVYDKQLIRFRGMIQDILNPIYYIEKFEILNMKTNEKCFRSGKYRDLVDLNDDEKILHDSEDKVFQEKYIMHCVQIPGLNSWTKQFKYVDDQMSVSSREGKRKLDDPDIADSQSMDLDDVKMSSDNNVKRLSVVSNPNENTNSIPSVTNEAELGENLQPTSNDQSLKSVILNLYDCKDSSILVNDIVEVVGFFSLKRALEPMEDGDNEYVASLPVIHVIHTTVGRSPFDSMLTLHKELIFQNAIYLRDEFWIMLTDMLLGDTLAADYMICHLISSVYSRKDRLVLGKLSLNISNVPTTLNNTDYVPSVYRFLAHLLEKSIYLPLTIEYLNDTLMIPKKDYDQNRLMAGLLQISNKTQIVIDETKLQQGTLRDRGVRNVKALNDMISYQNLSYDFGIYQLPFDLNCPILALSEGKSLLTTDCHLVLEPDASCTANASDCFNRAWKKMCDPLLSKLRFYLNNISSLDYDLTTEMRKTIESDYVKMRQDKSTSVNANDLSNLLILSRLISISRGNKCLENEAWEYACRMESQRKSRLK